MILLNTVLNKVHVQNLAVHTWLVFLNTRPLVKKNNAEFTNVSSFTSLLVCSVHFTLSCRTLLAFPTSNNFVQCICFEIPVQSAWGYCLGPLGVGYFSGHSSSSKLDSFGFWACDILDLAASCGKFLFVYVLYINMYCRVHSVAGTFGHLTVFIRTE